MTGAARSAACSRRRTVAYWGTTVVLATECLVGGVLGALRWPPYAALLGRLGFPPYVMTVLGVCYGLAGGALLAPRLPRLKEWASPGLVFNSTGAVAAHLAAGDRAAALGAPLVFTAPTAASWALRPPARRDPAPGPAGGPRPGREPGRGRP
jgi:hypothetical protein